MAIGLLLGACASSARGTPGPADAGGPSPAADAPLAPTAGPPLAPVSIRVGEGRALQHLGCAIAGAGDGVVVWREKDREERSAVWVSQLVANRAGWQPAQPLRAPGAVEIDGVAAAVDEQGRALAVWNEFDGTTGLVSGARFAPEGGAGSSPRWSSPAPLAVGWILNLVGGPAGEAAAYGILEGASMPTLLRHSPDRGWEPDSGLATARAGFFFADPRGRGLLIWNQPAAPGAQEVLAARHPFRGSWSDPTRVQEGRAFDHPLPSVNAALAADGSGLVVWNRGGDLQGELWAAVTDADGGWEAPHRLADGEAPLWTTTPLWTVGGEALVIWETGNPPRRKVWAARRRGGAWQPSVVLGQGSEIATGALSPSGEALVSWSTPGGLQARRSAPAGAWGPPSVAGSGAEGIADLCAGIDADGRAWMIWIGSSPQVVRAARMP
jgi:hypothetical protein